MKNLKDELAARMTLTELRTRAWRATRLNKRETNAVNARHSTKVRNAAKVLVRISDHPALTEISKIDSEAYRVHRALTMPSCSDGWRLLARGKQLAHSEALSELGNRRSPYVAAFIADYDHERREAPKRLGGLYEPECWPDKRVVAEKFSFVTRYLACPTDGSWNEWLTETAQVAQSELHERLHDAVKHVAERCSQDGRLFASVFGNLQEILDLAPDFDLEGRYGKVMKAAKEIAGSDVEILRDDEDERKRIADKANKILSIFGDL